MTALFIIQSQVKDFDISSSKMTFVIQKDNLTFYGSLESHYNRFSKKNDQIK